MKLIFPWKHKIAVEFLFATVKIHRDMVYKFQHWISFSNFNLSASIEFQAAAVAGISPKSNKHKQKLYKQIMLCRLASEQAEPNFDLLCIIRQCVEAFLILATFNLKTTKPLQAFFDSNVSRLSITCQSIQRCREFLAPHFKNHSFSGSFKVMTFLWLRM